MKIISDEELVAQIQNNGDETAFAELVNRYQGLVYDIVYRFSRNMEDAKDLRQNVFRKAYEKLSQLGDPSRFKAWLAQIATNEGLLLYRERDRQRQLEERLVEGQVEKTPYANSQPEEFVLGNELSENLEHILDRLKERNPVRYTIFNLIEEQGLKLNEVANRLRMPVGTVKSNWSRAQGFLKSELLKRGLGR